MHKHSHSEVERLAVEQMEIQFMRSPHGKPFNAEYEQLVRDMQLIDKRYDELWEKAGTHFMEYMRSM